MTGSAFFLLVLGLFTAEILYRTIMYLLGVLIHPHLRRCYVMPVFNNPIYDNHDAIGGPVARNQGYRVKLTGGAHSYFFALTFLNETNDIIAAKRVGGDASMVPTYI